MPSKFFLFILMFFLLYEIKAQNKKTESVKSNTDSVNISLPEIMVPQKKYKVKVIQLNKYKGYIFPKEYADTYFCKENLKGFDLDSLVIQEVETELLSNYIEVNRTFMELRFKEMYELKRNNSDANNWDKLKKEEKKYFKEFRKNRDKWMEHITSRDRQYLGYINKKGEKIVLINLIELGDDPCCLRKNLDKKIILMTNNSCCESNIMHYNFSQKKLSVNEE